MDFLLWPVIFAGSALLAWRLLARTTRELPSAHGSDVGTADDVAQAVSQWDALRGASSPEHNEPWDGVDRLKALDNNGGL